MLITALTLAMSLVICIASIRWTQHWPSRLRRPALSLLISLLFPLLLFGPNFPSFLPVSLCFVAAVIMGDSMPDNFVTALLLQTSIVWVIVYGVWTAFAGLFSDRMEDPVWKRRMKLAAIVCSAPGWFLMVVFFFYQSIFDQLGPDDISTSQDVSVIISIFLVLSMLAMAMALLSAKDDRISPVDIFLTLGLSLPVLFEIMIIFMLWFGISFDRSFEYHRYSDNNSGSSFPPPFPLFAA
jgi:hypothetical protein